MGGTYGNGESKAGNRVKGGLRLERGEEAENGPRWRWELSCLSSPLQKPNYFTMLCLQRPKGPWDGFLHRPQDFTPLHFQLSHLRIFKTSANNNFLKPSRAKVTFLVATLWFLPAKPSHAEPIHHAGAQLQRDASRAVSFLVTVIRGESVALNL